MDKYIESFIKYIKIERNFSDHTETGYVHDIEKFLDFIYLRHVNFKNVDYDLISNYISYMKKNSLSPTSINRNLSSLRTFYNYLLKENVVLSNPFNLVKSQKKPIRLPNYMKYNEFILMLDSCDESILGVRNRALLEVLLSTGARASEVVGIKIKDVDLASGEIKVLGKGNKERICYFMDNCRQALENYINSSRPLILKNKNSDYLFLNHLGNPLTTRGLRDIIDKIILKVGVDFNISPHTFRHTFATMLLNEGCELRSVQELLGHANLSTTSIYTHLSNDYIKEVYLHTHPRTKK